MAGFTVNVSIPFPTSWEANIVYDVLRIDKEPSRGAVTKTFRLMGNILQVSFYAMEARKLRVSVTSFFDNIILVSKTVQQFGPKEST